jgi:hypothetical protein
MAIVSQCVALPLDIGLAFAPLLTADWCGD